MPADKTPSDRTPTDTPPLKRRFWQIHLSTAGALSIIAGALMYGNLVVYQLPDEPLGFEDESGHVHPIHRISSGWPMQLETMVIDDIPRPEPMRRTVVPAVNLLSALSILTTMGIGLEYLIRRRSKP